MSGYKTGDVLMLTYTKIQVGRRITADESDALNRGEIPWEGVTSVVCPKGKVHYFPTCGGKEIVSLSRSVSSTTCKTCLLRRAIMLRGWRWTHPNNTEEVAYLTAQLGSRVAGFGDQNLYGHDDWPTFPEPK